MRPVSLSPEIVLNSENKQSLYAHKPTYVQLPIFTGEITEVIGMSVN